ncbi:hypothetical protein [Ruegeria sp. HKCCD6428]|uniref:hypothetical protein n=1 Tax=Ruegeria sp. HKCCD6428 TaxID=2683002 RepID=UPI0014917A35|nr:hypothetical protein [Ruegeria sp. HKCCD6428]NOC83334.1 hypothetical protein [Ruegeria sp. HKCCD6428]
MINRKARRKAASGANRADVAAFCRLEERRLSGVPAVRISDEAAMLALLQASPAARRLVLGMVLHIMKTGGRPHCVFEDAVRAVGGRALSWRTVEELHQQGILRFERGATVLHRVFSGTGKQWARIAENSLTCDAPYDISQVGNNIVAFESAAG